jgi:general secretion pathway protein E
MPYSESIQKMTTAKVNFEKIRIRAKEEGMVTLRQNAIKKMLDGVTTYKEVLRVTSVRRLLQG